MRLDAERARMRTRSKADTGTCNLTTTVVQRETGISETCNERMKSIALPKRPNLPHTLPPAHTNRLIPTGQDCEHEEEHYIHAGTEPRRAACSPSVCASIRANMRRSRAMAAGKASALDDLARRKESARKRKDARDFLVQDQKGPAAGSDDDEDGYTNELEDEFMLEDELSIMMSSADRKRKRTRALQPGVRRAAPAAPAKPMRRVAPAFFNAAHRAALRGAPDMETGEEKSVFNQADLDAELAREGEKRRSSRAQESTP
eukprot:IDg7929t1